MFMLPVTVVIGAISVLIACSSIPIISVISSRYISDISPRR